MLPPAALPPADGKHLPPLDAASSCAPPRKKGSPLRGSSECPLAVGTRPAQRIGSAAPMLAGEGSGLRLGARPSAGGSLDWAASLTRDLPLPVRITVEDNKARFRCMHGVAPGCIWGRCW